MKKIVLVVFIFTSSVSFAQVSVYTQYFGGELIPYISIFGTKPINERVNFTYYSLLFTNGAEVMLGFSYSLADWVEVGLNCGLENPASFRGGSSIWLGKGKTSFLTFLEKGIGKDNYWYDSILSYEIKDNLSLGIRAWRFIGIGPLAEYKVNDFKFWIIPAYEFESKNVSLVLGIDLKI